MIAHTPTSIRRFINAGWARIPARSLSAELVDKCYAEWVEFFASSEKDNFKAAPGQLDGFFPMHSETVLGAQYADPKEFFHFYKQGQCPPSCRETTSLLFSKFVDIAVTLFRDVAADIPRLEKYCHEIAASKRLVLRVAHYVGNEASLFNAPHEDIDFLTILPRATDPGLEILEGSSWKPMMVKPGECIALAGDMIMEASRGQIIAVRHRVVATVPERLSMSFFLNPDDDVELSPQWTAGQFLADRLRDSGYVV